MLLAIDRFALTANNITYCVSGDMLGYWRFLPMATHLKIQAGSVNEHGFKDVSAHRDSMGGSGEALPGAKPGSEYGGRECCRYRLM